MQQIVIEKPYRFIPPYRGELWIRLLRRYLPGYLKRFWGIGAVEYRGLEHLRASVVTGHGILLACNHPRLCDPLVVGLLSQQVNRLFYSMASWHVFVEGGKLRGWLIRRMGSFSVHRWGLDPEAVRASINILTEARRPLIIFAEGHCTRTNDRLTTLLDGTAFIARFAAIKRAKTKPPGQVVIHPVVLKYFFEGNLLATLDPVLTDIERRLAWQPQHAMRLQDRIVKVGSALLALKEIEYLGDPRPGPIAPRIETLIEYLLQPLEKEWLHGHRESPVAERAKLLRTAILPDLVSGELSQIEHDRRWRQLADIYLAQQLALYPPGYVASNPTPEHMLETVERFEEDLTDVARIHRPLRVVIQIGEAMSVDPHRPRRGIADSLMIQLDQRLRATIETLAAESKPRNW
jgi:1-acyl-sn-glycerol-3-phosphate acyltransferase